MSALPLGRELGLELESGRRTLTDQALAAHAHDVLLPTPVAHNSVVDEMREVALLHGVVVTQVSFHFNREELVGRVVRLPCLRRGHTGAASIAFCRMRKCQEEVFWSNIDLDGTHLRTEGICTAPL